MLPDKKDQTRPPKTRFNSRDRSKGVRTTCIPRLKSFPAEKVKKLNDPPTFSCEPIGVPLVQRDPREVFLASSSVGINCDRGDATSFELSPAHQQFKPPREAATNQQQVAPNYQQTDQTSPQSDSLQTCRRTGSPERQARHPHAANAYQEVVVRNRSPRDLPTTISQQVIVQRSPTRGTKRALEPSVERDRDETVALECEEQPVASRNAASHRRAIMQMQQQQRDANDRQGVRLRGASEASSRHPLTDSRQPICQQPQYDVYHQQVSSQALNHAQSSIPEQQQQVVCDTPETRCSYWHQRVSAAQLAPAQGMTSPQDMTISQMRLTRHNLPVHQQNFGAWPLDGRWTGHNQQHSCQQQQQQAPPPQWGCHYQDMQDNSFNQQSPEEQDQRVPSRNQGSYKVATDRRAVKEAHGRQDDCKKRALQFTPNMIRDQELLIATMRQQGVPHDVMRRQFDALLNEQHRHLAYVAQFQQQADVQDVKRTCRLVRRRTENDEKPEWMVHITPPRISYSDLERIQSQQRAPSERQPTDDRPSREVGRAVPVQLQQQDYRPQQPTEETIAPAVSPQRVYLRMSPYQWQQRAADWSRRGDHRAPCGFMACYPYGHQRSAPNRPFYRQPSFSGLDQPQQGFYRCLHDASHHTANPIHSYQVHPEHQKAWLEGSNASPLDKLGVSADAVRERSERPSEPSSLLKMRVYKETIRPQKRNNGLQDPGAVERALETLKDPTSKKGLEYLANLARKKLTIRLNGTQESDEIPEGLRAVSSENAPCASRKASANGLENSRNPDNPAPRAPRPRKPDGATVMEYPRQRQKPTTCYGAPAEMLMPHADARDAGSIPRDRARTANHAATLLPHGGAPDYQQVQRCCHSRQKPASHNGGQGDGIASMQRPSAPDATGIDRAGGDALGENSASAGGTSSECRRRCGEQSMPGTCSYGRPEFRDARTIACAHLLPASKPDCAPNNLTAVSPSDKLLASSLAQPPTIL